MALATSGSDQTKEHRKRGYAQRAELVAIISLMGWGLGYFGQPHIRRVLWRRILTTASSMRVVSVDLDDPLPGRGGGCRLLWYRFFNEHPAVAGAVNQNAERVFTNWRKFCLTRGLPGFCCRQFGGGNVNLKLPAAGMFQCDYRDLYKAFLRKHASQKELVWVGV